eukprot:m51a1_g12845 putative structural maintenance of chromosome protein (612) ;mRNA; f:698-3170
MHARVEEQQATFRALNVRVQELQGLEGEANGRLRAINQSQQATQRRLRELDDERSRRLQFLQRTDRDIYNGYMWLMENKHLFRSPVYGPVFVECQVQQQQYAAYVEAIAGRTYLYSFVATTQEDRETLIRELSDRQRIQVGILLVDAASPMPRAPAPLDSLRQYGVECYLNEAVHAPEPRVANETAKGHLDQLPVGLTLTPTSVMNRVQSRYEDRSVSTVVTPLQPARAMNPVDLEQRARLEQELRDSREEQASLEAQLKEIIDEAKAKQLELAEIKNTREAYNAEKRKHDTHANRIRLKEKNLQVLQNEEDTGQEEETLKAKIADLACARCHEIDRVVEVLKELMKARDQYHVAFLHHHDVRSQADAAQRAAAVARSACESAKAKLDKIDTEFQRAKDEAKRLKDEAERIAPLTDELKIAFAELPKEIEEIDSEIASARTKVEVNVYTNPRVVKEYEARQQQIEELEARLREETGKLEEHRAEITRMRNAWLPKLEDVVSRINGSFSRFMMQIGCSGEVSLVRNDEDYDKYAILVKVKFRDGSPLAPLNSYTQSGGEKSVSTMLYMISLQGLSHCPFRLVDEINQGMDAKNERMVFSQVAKVGSEPGCPQ